MANNSSPPDWTEIDEDILCPLCEYNLRGLPEPRCPECGYRFAWPEVIDPTRRLHRYLFEHHPERNVWSFWKTAIGGFLPRRFWRTLQPVQPSRPKRLMLYWVLLIAIALLGVTGQYIRAAIDLNRDFVQWRNWNRTSLNRPQHDYRKQRIINDYGSVQGFLDAVMPLPPSPRFYVKVPYYDASAGGLLLLFVCYVLWAWMTFAALLVFRWSMRRAKVKPIHVWRCVIYSFDVGLWIGLAILAATIVSLVVTGSARLNQFVLAGILLLCLALALEAIYRLWMAYRTYLRFDHSLLTVISSQLIVFLAMLRLFFLIQGL